jgi:hypothetical protein
VARPKIAQADRSNANAAFENGLEGSYLIAEDSDDAYTMYFSSLQPVSSDSTTISHNLRV